MAFAVIALTAAAAPFGDSMALIRASSASSHGSTALSPRMDPEDLREVISSYQKAVADTLQRFGGFVAKYMGDGVLVYFGYPQAHEDDAERVVRQSSCRDLLQTAPAAAVLDHALPNRLPELRPRRRHHGATPAHPDLLAMWTRRVHQERKADEITNDHSRAARGRARRLGALRNRGRRLNLASVRAIWPPSLAAAFSRPPRRLTPASSSAAAAARHVYSRTSWEDARWPSRSPRDETRHIAANIANLPDLLHCS